MGQINSISILSTSQEFGNDKRDLSGFHPIGGIFIPLFLLVFMLHAPVALIWLEIIPFEYRFHLFFCFLAGIVFYCSFRRYGLHELGFRTDNLRSSLGWNMLFCAVGAMGLYMTYKAGFLRSRDQNFLPYVYIFYIFFLGPVQEVFFRGILFAEMKRAQILDNRWILLISTLSFCFLHLIYRRPPLLLMALISGLIWGIIFTKWPNIWGIALSHSLLGALAIFLGVI